MRYGILYQIKPLLCVCQESDIFPTRKDAEDAIVEQGGASLTLKDGRTINPSLQIIWKVGYVWRNLLGQDIGIVSFKGEPA